MRRWALLLLMMLAPSAFAKNAVAVHYFDTESTGEFQGLKVGLAQMLATDMLNTEGRNFDVVERSKVQAVLDELKLGQSGSVDKTTAAKVGKMIGARYLVFGTVTGFMGTMRIDARLVDVETSKQIGAAGADGPVADFMRIQREVALGIGKAMLEAPEYEPGDPTDIVAPQVTPKGPAVQPAPENPAPERSSGKEQLALNESTRAAVDKAGPELYTPDPKVLEAAQAYSDGLIFMDAGEDVKARERFQSALASKPNLAHAKSALAALEI